MSDMALTGKRLLFVDEFMIDMNATQAAKRAGYSEKTAYSMGHELLKKPEIQAAIAEARAERSKRTEITQDKVIAELAKIGFADVRKAVAWGSTPVDDGEGGLVYPVELIPSSEIDDDTAAAITEVSLTAQGVKVKMADKRAALETLLKHTTQQAGTGDEVASALRSIADKLPG
ncbi:MAG: putative terminase small subunit [Prokaryotic dsDNA virus sp.]|nr:MAG: putative terminase small subunit [Prokaryotic dsDNA virus sp.]|tara:strand:- start:19324 stop:19845 length:522 start_codon:yes stop_codon:yes gene_type:complete